MDPLHYSVCSDFNDHDNLIHNFSDEELSEIMLSFIANQEINPWPTNPNHYADSYAGYGGLITGANINTIGTPLLHDILNTTSSPSCSSESSPPPTVAPQRGISNDNYVHPYPLFSNIGSGIADDVDHGMTTTASYLDVATYYQQPAAANYARTPSVAPVADGDSYYGTTTQLCNNNDVKVGQYTAEERKDRILRYLKKRNQRNFNKTIKYACRKTLADRRVRVRGRFARNSNELSEEDITAPPPQRRPSEDDGFQHYYRHHHQRYLQQDNQSYNENDVTHVQVKPLEEEDDDQWLQEAMASLLYAPPYVAAG